MHVSIMNEALHIQLSTKIICETNTYVNTYTFRIKVYILCIINLSLELNCRYFSEDWPNVGCLPVMRRW